MKYLLQASCLAALAWEWKTHLLDSTVFTQRSLSKCSYILKMTGVCCDLIHCLWGIHCIASLDHQTDRRVGRSASLNANQKRSVCLRKPPRDDIDILYHPVDNAEATRWERASYFPCLKIRSSNTTWYAFDRCSASTHSAWRKEFLGSSVCTDELQFSHHLPTTPPPHHPTTTPPPHHPTTTSSLLFSLMCHTQSIKEALVIKWNWFIFNVYCWVGPSWKSNTQVS